MDWVDILAADPGGYYRVYFNSGTKDQPQFTHAEILPINLADPSRREQRVPWVNLFDCAHRGVCDLMVGNYWGEVMFLPNIGTRSTPDFRQPTTPEKAAIPTAKKEICGVTCLLPLLGIISRPCFNDVGCHTFANYAGG